MKMFEWPRLCYPYEISFDFVVYQPAYYRRDRGLFRLDAVRDYFGRGSIFAVFMGSFLEIKSTFPRQQKNTIKSKISKIIALTGTFAIKNIDNWHIK